MIHDLTLEDFLRSMDQLTRLGPLKSIMKIVPGLRHGDCDPDKDIQRFRAIIQSMTSAERTRPEGIDESRRMRIARGSGTDKTDVLELQTQFATMKSMMRKIQSLNEDREDADE